jgi:dihydrodipicolinate synthase/N-acetylneuraminate lyase
MQTEHLLNWAFHADREGADAILMGSVYYLNPPERMIIDRFVTIANTIPSLPIIIDNDPERTGFDITPDIVREIRKNVKNPLSIAGIRECTVDGPKRVKDLRRAAGPDFKIYWYSPFL